MKEFLIFVIGFTTIRTILYFIFERKNDDE